MASTSLLSLDKWADVCLDISCCTKADNADVAQLVEHHLAKVRVAGSSPVIRSEVGIASSMTNCHQHGGLAERRGNGLQSRVHGFESRTHLARAIGAAGARFLDTEEVTGSSPVSPTMTKAERNESSLSFPKPRKW